MNNKNSKKYSRVAKLIGILSGFILVLGTSYAVFRVTTTGEKENVVSAGKLDVRIENEQNEITINNALPQTEEEGKQNTPYTFDIVNRGNINAMYDLYLEVNNESTLDARVIRYYLTVVEDGEEKQITPVGNLITNEEENRKEGKKAYKIDTKYLDVNKTNNYKLYLWLDYDTEAEQAINKTFKANVRVDAEQIYKGNKLIRQVDVSENNDGSVTAYMYGNDTVVIKGQGQIKSGLSDSLKFVSDEVLPNYKKVLQSMGVDVSNINTLDDLQNYIDSQGSDFNHQLNDQVTYICAKEVLKEMNKDSDKVVDFASLLTYLQELGYIDEEGNTTEAGEEFFTKFEAKYNKNYSIETRSPKKIVIEDGITNIPRGLFQENENITEVKIPSSVTSIADNAFFNCSNLTSITIPDSVTSIGTYAFYSCNNLTSITIPNNVTSIANNTFRFCKNLTSITIPSSVISIGDYAFYYCSNLTSITIPNSVTSIGYSSFEGCKNLTAITIPDSVTSIEAWAFNNCSNLTSITLSKNVTKINMSAFENCSNLTSIKIPNSVTRIGNSAFENCSNLISITIPDSVTSIGNSAFENCSNLTSITIPDSVTSIGSIAFSGCTSLNSINIGTNNPNYSSENGIVYNKNKTTLVKVPGGKSNVTIPSSVTRIGENAFASCSNLTSITLPNNVTLIENSAFQYCSNLISITLSNKLRSIGNYAFWGCSSLTSITIPASVTSIGNYAFASCSNLTSITIPNSVTRIGNSAFENCSNLTTINIDNTKAYVDANWNSSWKSGCNANVNYLRT